MTTDATNRDRAAALTKEAIAAFKAGQRSQAREALAAAVRADSSYELAWLWLSELLERPAEKRACLERVLALNPAHAQARAQLARLQAAEAPAAPPVAPAVAPPSPVAPAVAAPPPAAPAPSQPQPPAWQETQERARAEELLAAAERRSSSVDPMASSTPSTGLGGAPPWPAPALPPLPARAEEPIVAVESPAAPVAAPATGPQPAVRGGPPTLVILLGGLLLALLLSGAAYLLLSPSGVAMAPTEAPPADWHQLRGADGVSMWAPTSYKGGTREQFVQAMTDSGLSDVDMSLLQLQLPQDVNFAMADPSGGGPDATWFTLAYVMRDKEGQISPQELEQMSEIFGEDLGSFMPQVVSQETRMLGPQQNIKAQRIVTEGFGFGGTQTTLLYYFEHNGEVWAISFSTLFSSPGLLEQYDQMVRTMSIEP